MLVDDDLVDHPEANAGPHHPPALRPVARLLIDRVGELRFEKAQAGVVEGGLQAPLAQGRRELAQRYRVSLGKMDQLTPVTMLEAVSLCG